MRTSFEPLPPKIIKYRNYKNFDENEFRFLFKTRLNDFNADDISADIFEMTFLNVLNKFAPLKKKYLRANHFPFVNKELNKAIMENQGFVMHILKTELEQLGQLTKNKEMCASAFYVNLKNVAMKI